MLRSISLALGAALAFGTVVPAYAQSAAPSSTPDPAVTAHAKTFYHALSVGSIDRSQLSAQANRKLTEATLKQVAAQLGPLGEPVTFEYVKSLPQGDATLHAYLLSFGGGQRLEFVIGFDGQGKVSALALRPYP